MAQVKQEMRTAMRDKALHDKAFGGTPLFILPTFLGARGQEHGEPRDKAGLETAVKAGKITPANLCQCYGCHGPTEFARWFRASAAYRVQFSWFFEPYFVAPQKQSHYDARFMGYGNDKQSKIYDLFVHGAYFIVLPISFQVHQWHPASQIWGGPCGERPAGYGKQIQREEEYGDKSIHQVMCNYVEETAVKIARLAPGPIHPNAARAIQVPASHLCWSFRCPSNVRVRVTVGDEREGSWAFTVHTYRDNPLRALMALLAERAGPIRGVQVFLGVDGIGLPRYEGLRNDPGRKIREVQAWACGRVVQIAGGDRCSSECGPRKYFGICCQDNPYCNEQSGWCGSEHASYRDAQLGNTYDAQLRSTVEKGNGTRRHDRLCDRISQWSPQGWSTPVVKGASTVAPTLHLRVWKVPTKAGVVDRLPGSSGIVAGRGREASLDFPGMQSLTLTTTDFRNQLDEGFTVSRS